MIITTSYTGTNIKWSSPHHTQEQSQSNYFYMTLNWAWSRYSLATQGSGMELMLQISTSVTSQDIRHMRLSLELCITSDLHHHQLYAQSSCSWGLGMRQLDRNLPLSTRMTIQKPVQLQHMKAVIPSLRQTSLLLQWKQNTWARLYTMMTWIP